MNTRTLQNSLLVAVLVTAPASALLAQTVAFFGFGKRVSYLQTSASTPVLSAVPGDGDGLTYHFDVDVNGTSLNLYSALTLTLPDGTTVYTLVDKGPMDNTDFGLNNAVTHGFSSKSALDAAFPNGTYLMNIGIPAVGMPLGPSDTYPAEIPTVTGGTWDGNGHYLVNAAAGATISFNSFSGYAGGGYIHGTVYDYTGSVVGSTIVTQANIKALGDPATTAFTIAPGVLQPGKTYYAELTFGRLTFAISDFGGTGHADFDYLTGFLINTPKPAADFNADGKADIVWSNTNTGDRYVWLMNGGSLSSSVFLGTVGASWQLATGDFNGDGKLDIFWSNTGTGDRYVWLMNGGTVATSVFLATVAPQWSATTGDFNGDGKADVLWSNTSTGDRYVWLMNGGTVTSSVFLATIGTQWTARSGDFNGDGKADILWSNTSSGDRYVWLMSGGTVTASVFLATVAPQWTPALADFNGDGKADILWSNTTSGDRYAWLMSGGTVSSSIFLATVGTQWTAATGDFNGDGKADILWSNGTTGDRYVWLMNGGSLSSSIFLGTVNPVWQAAL